MKTVSIRDLRERWPEIEKALQIEQEILITRNGQPVAKLSRIVAERWRPLSTNQGVTGPLPQPTIQ